MKRLCVFCGSNAGFDSRYAEAARKLGHLLANEGVGIVYGGGRVGLMGVLADAALAEGGEVIGVIPRPLLTRERAHTGLSDLRVVSSMHERKATMAELSDGFVALPGGIGTLEELFEVWTWAQLGVHEKPCGLLNVGGYYDGLLAFLDHAVEQGFVREASRGILVVEAEPERLLSRLESYEPPAFRHWVRPAAT